MQSMAGVRGALTAVVLALVLGDVEAIARRHGFEVASGIGGGDHHETATKGDLTVRVQVPRASGTGIEIRIAAS